MWSAKLARASAAIVFRVKDTPNSSNLKIKKKKKNFLMLYGWKHTQWESGLDHEDSNQRSGDQHYVLFQPVQGVNNITLNNLKNKFVKHYRPFTKKI